MISIQRRIICFIPTSGLEKNMKKLFLARKRNRYSLLKFQVNLSIPLRFYNIDMELLSSLLPSEQYISFLKDLQLGIYLSLSRSI